MKNLNIVVSSVGEQRTLEGNKSTEDVIAYVGNITPEMNQPNQDPMYLGAADFTEEQIPPEIAKKLRENAARRITESSLARRQERAAITETREEANR